MSGKCPKCGSSCGIDKLQESAILVCPNCGTEFSLAAQVTRMGGEDEIPEPDMTGEFEEPEEEEEPPPPEEEEPEEEEGESTKRESKKAERQPVLKTKVLVCGECNSSWLGLYADKCPKCESEEVMMSDRPITDRVHDAFTEVDSGVDVNRALDRLVGTFV